MSLEEEIIITHDTAVSYRPSTLVLFDRLIELCDAVKAELDSLLSDNTQAKVVLPVAPEGTAIATFLAGLTGTTKPQAIDDALMVPADVDEKITALADEEARLRATDPSKERTRLTDLATKLATVRVHLAFASVRPAGRRLTAVRPRADHALASAVARRLTPRDRLLCRALFDHKVLTTEQVTDLCFENLITARHRLTALYELRVLDRFRPFRPVGSDPYHYVLDTLGVEIVAADRGVEVPRPGLRHSRALALSDSQRLAHLLGVNGLFCALARWARTVEDAELAEWWPERRCATEWGEVVRPDGFGTLRQWDRVVEFFVELDRGTETLARLADKLAGYAELVRATGWTPLVCFWFPGPRREAEARRVLAHPEVPIATGAAGLGAQAGPGGPAWFPVGSTGPRRHLIDLATTTGRRS